MMHGAFPDSSHKIPEEFIWPLQHWVPPPGLEPHPLPAHSPQLKAQLDKYGWKRGRDGEGRGGRCVESRIPSQAVTIEVLPHSESPTRDKTPTTSRPTIAAWPRDSPHISFVVFDAFDAVRASLACLSRGRGAANDNKSERSGCHPNSSKVL